MSFTQHSVLSTQHYVLLGILDDEKIKRYFELGCEETFEFLTFSKYACNKYSGLRRLFV